MAIDSPAKRRSVTPIGDQELRHGYTPTQLHQMTKLAVNTARAWLAMDFPDLMEAAWFAMVEHLYTAEERPAGYELIRAGQQAVNNLAKDEMHHRGYFKFKSHGSAHGAGSSPAFVKFWTNTNGDFETGVIERVALVQIFGEMRSKHRDVLLALAAHGDYMAAAQSLDTTYSTFKSYISHARREFLRLWHEHEIPSKPWGCDRRVEAYGKERATHCGLGHEYTPENTRERGRGQGRKCKKCEYERGVRRALAARSGAAGISLADDPGTGKTTEEVTR